MIHVKTAKTKERSVIGYLISALFLFLCLYLLLVATREISARSKAEQLEVLDQAIQRATIQCYAIEGRYPPSVEYLEEHYGLTIDRDNYHVFYDGWASNIMPEITVLPAREAEEGRLWQ